MPNLYKELNRDHKNDGISSDGSAVNPTADNSPKPKTTKPDFTKYVDTTGELSGTDLKRYLWFSKHQVSLYRLLISFLIALIVFSFGYSLWQMGDYLIFGYTKDAQLYQDLSGFDDYSGIHSHYGPQALQILSVDGLESGVNKFDEVAQILNPNDRFVVEFDYYFNFGSNTTSREHAVLMPLENRPVAALGLDSNTFGGSGNLVIEGIAWTRISNHEVSDMQEFLDNHLQFRAENVVFTSTAQANSASANVINFKLTNGSAFSYRAPKFLFGLYQGGSLAAVIPWLTDDFYSLTSKNVDLRSFVSGLSANEVQIYPLINWFDKDYFVDPPTSL